ncbi:MAG: hypothetical protein ACREPM_03635 [Gemmatimonadaceae bacterium]
MSTNDRGTPTAADDDSLVVTDLNATAPDEKTAEQVKGGADAPATNKVHVSEFHVTKSTDSTSPL